MDDATKLKIQQWREKCRAGTVTQEEYKEIIATIRDSRMIASAQSTKARTAKAKAKAEVNSDDLLSELE